MRNAEKVDEREDVYVDERELARRTGLSARFWQARRQAGDGPPYIQVSARCIRYSWRKVKTWLEARERLETGS